MRAAASTAPAGAQRPPRRLLWKLGAALGGVLLGLAICEGVLRRVVFTDGEYDVWPPHLQREFHIRPGKLPGVEGDVEFRANSLGMRADELEPSHTRALLAVGGSTTLCRVLDQTKTWPYRLQTKLNQQQGDQSAWVGNIGMSGRKAPHHVLHLRYLLPRLPQIQTVLVLMGINDLTLRLSHEDYRARLPADADFEDAYLDGAFMIHPRHAGSGAAWYRHLALWQWGQQLYGQESIVRQHIPRDTGTRTYRKFRQRRQHAKAIRPSLPDLTDALKEYAADIEDMIATAHTYGRRLIFLTQPTLWKAGLSPDLEALLWFGGIGNFQAEPEHEYYSVEALAHGMDLYNATLVETCRKHQIEVIDLATQLPKDTTVFYDDCHFNEGGAEQTAQIIADYLVAHPHAPTRSE
jgi:lysophospholipase L1-like esterase